MLDKPLDEITKSDLQWLIDNKISESIHLEYKGELKVKTNSDKKELCKDVSAMANSFGGRIIFGIKEKKQKEDGSIPEKLQPIKDKSLKETMQQVLADGVLPRMDFRIQPVPDKEKDGEYVIVEVPQSISGPHFVCYKKENRFYKRRDYEAKPMDQREIEDAYRNFFFQEQKLENIYEKRKQENPNKNLGIPYNAYCFIYFIPQYPVHNLFHRKYDHETLTEELSLMRRHYLGSLPRFYSNSFWGYEWKHRPICTIKEKSKKVIKGQDIFFRNGAALVSFTLYDKEKIEDNVPYFTLQGIAGTLDIVFENLSELYKKCGYPGNVRVVLDIMDAKNHRLHLSSLQSEITLLKGYYSAKFTTSISILSEAHRKETLNLLIPLAQSYGFEDNLIDQFLQDHKYNTTVEEFYQRKAKE
jgi:hypothetical protein